MLTSDQLQTVRQSMYFATRLKYALLSLGSGLLLGLGFAPLGWWPATILGIALFIRALNTVFWRRAA